MRNNVRVEHILIERLEHDYAKTLCGRIIYSPGATFGTYPEPNYFRHNRPDCQDCLRKHFSKQRRKL